ncbi:MAG TPA: DUF6351 family protein [Gaiellaceae bacterium]|nr:DUF6351 family protein [Gaiellaceae bacterium]
MVSIPRPQARWLAVGLGACALAATTLSGSAVASTSEAGGVGEITVLSNRADLISGGDALVSVDLLANPRAVRVELNGNDITDAFAIRPNGRFEGLVTGLVEGKNVLRVRPANGVGRWIEISNHPIGGPVFSGPQIQPWLCRTQFQTNPSLGPSIDDQCNAPTVIERFYRNLSNQFVPYDPASPPAPESIQQTTTDEGKTVPFVVERVTGTADRGIYQYALLVDPTKPVSPWSTEQPWNHKYVNSFGGACGVNYQQPTVGNQLTGQNVALLARGVAVGTSSLNTYANQCNDIVSAEALMMTKELLIERHGPIRYTIGTGGSAGTMQQHLIAEAYPGLLDGLTTSLLYEDHWYQVVSSFDCILLWRYFGLGNPFLGFPATGNALFATPQERQKVWGSNPANPDNLCGSKIVFTLVELVASSTFGCSGPPNTPPWRWDPVTNPTGARCTIQDYQKAMFGVGQDGKAPRPLDNVGVQYGLQALEQGTLTPEQFVDVNERIGGLDIDGVWQPERTEADVGALETLYRTGRIVSGRGAASAAEIEVRSNITDTGFHPPFHSFTYRARLDRTNGNHSSHVIWVPNGGQTPDQILTVDAWLAAVEADTSDDPLPDKIARNKPAAAVDACFRAGGVIQDVMCNGDWQFYSNPRLVAGWPFTLDHFKCRLKPLNRADYPVSFTEDQWQRLQQAFPTGVCDYAKPPVGQQPSIPWITFADGPGGRPLGDPPTSQGPPETAPGNGP